MIGIPASLNAAKTSCLCISGQWLDAIALDFHLITHNRKFHNRKLMNLKESEYWKYINAG